MIDAAARRPNLASARRIGQALDRLLDPRRALTAQVRRALDTLLGLEVVESEICRKLPASLQKAALGAPGQVGWLAGWGDPIEQRDKGRSSPSADFGNLKSPKLYMYNRTYNGERSVIRISILIEFITTC